MAEADTSTRPYWLTYGALILLLTATVAVAFVNLGTLNLVAAMVIAGIKALLVALVFMHVYRSSRLTWLFAAAGAFWLVLLLVLTACDYTTRRQYDVDPLQMRQGHQQATQYEPPEKSPNNVANEANAAVTWKLSAAPRVSAPTDRLAEKRESPSRKKQHELNQGLPGL